MKIKLNPMFEAASGQLGGLVFREVRGRTVASRKVSAFAEPSVDQALQRERFKQAAAYGRSALANPATRDLYEEAAKTRNIPVFAVTVADFFNAPTIDNLDVFAYNGQVGDPISILARDDFGVVNVRVSITDIVGSPIESGNAVETVSGSGQWVYCATALVAPDTEVVVNAVATDRPGSTGVSAKPRSL